MVSNYLVQNTELDDVEEVVSDALDIIEDSFEGGRNELIHVSLLSLAMNEAAFEVIRLTIEEYFAEFGYDVRIDSPEDITEEMLEITGERIPFISDFMTEQIFARRPICFVKSNGEIVNNPQSQLMGFGRRRNHNLLIRGGG